MSQSRVPVWILVGIGFLGAGFRGGGLELAYAQVTTSITPTPGTGSLGTTVSAPGGNVYNITGGTRPGNGTNLFHSFGEFSVGALDTARFLNTTPDLATANILGRVTGGNPSSLFGSIDTLSYGNANLFLLNPAGIVFGPNATLNVGGAVTFTTANYLRLADTGIFHADTTASSVLTSAPVAAFGFLGPNPASITVQGSQLTVGEGARISLIGGNITVEPGTLTDGSIQTARLSAPGGQINLASVASLGELPVSTFEPPTGMALGSITLNQGSLLDVSGNAGGTVRIRGGNLVIENAAISADSVDANGAPVAIDIQVTDNVSISNVDVPALTARTTGTGNAGEVKISSGSMEVTTTYAEAPFFFSTIDTHTTGPGNAGNVSINTGNLKVVGDPFGVSFFIDTGTSGPTPGRGGDVSIVGTTIDFESSSINTGNLLAFFLDEGGAGTAGNVTIKADHLKMSFSQIVTDSNDFVSPAGTSGDITIAARQVDFLGTSLSTSGNERSGAITIAADQFVATESGIQAITTSGQGGEIRITGNVIEFREGSNIASSTVADGHAGPIIITASDHMAFLDAGLGGRPGGIFNNSFGYSGSLGNAGDVFITTPRLQLTGGTRINTATATSGRGGDVTITADSISMSGENSGFEIEPLFNLGTAQSSGIYTRTIGGNCIGPCGNAGNISINTQSLAMGTGSQINSGSSSNGQGGIIAINAGNTIAMSGTLSTGQPGGIQSRTIGTDPDAGSGGNIALTAGQSVTISDGASVSASSTGPGNAGNIAINAGQQFEMRNSSVKTEAAQASGGNIDIQAIDRIRLVNSAISTSVLGGSGSGGNITIDPNVVILQNSQIIAQAVQGAGGNISITTPLFLADAGSLVDASSQFGLNGTVNIQSPTSNLAGTVSSLPSSLRQVQSLQTGRCAALADSRSSSLIVAGRDILPAEPGGWSPSPFALLGEETDSLAIASPPVAAMTASADTPVSLRRLTPAGFLTQSFAENGLTGCRA